MRSSPIVRPTIASAWPMKSASGARPRVISSAIASAAIPSALLKDMRPELTMVAAEGSVKKS